jgi:hypothetical protein
MSLEGFQSRKCNRLQAFGALNGRRFAIIPSDEIAHFPFSQNDYLAAFNSVSAEAGKGSGGHFLCSGSHESFDNESADAPVRLLS